jgi:hypothetical protein
MQAVKECLNDEVTIGVHVNIAAYAPFHLISQFLYHFLVFGILWDVTTGEMLALPPNIKWLVSICLFNYLSHKVFFYIYKIFIEIGQASPHDIQFLHRSTNAVLSALPIVQLVATLVPHERYFQKFPQASHEAQVCYAFTLQFIKDKDKLNSPLSPNLPQQQPLPQPQQQPPQPQQQPQPQQSKLGKSSDVSISVRKSLDASMQANFRKIQEEKSLEAARQLNDAINILNIPNSIPCNWNLIHKLLDGSKVNIPSQNILWSIFFSVMRDRCEWLKTYSKCILLFIYFVSVPNREIYFNCCFQFHFFLKSFSLFYFFTNT